MKIVVSDCDHANMEPEQAVFAEAGLSFVRLQCKTEADMIAQCGGAGIVLNQYAPFTRAVIAALAPDLKQIVRYGVGVDGIDLAAAAECGVRVCNVPDYATSEVSDQALAMMMALCRKIVWMNALVKAGTWDFAASVPLYRLFGKTVGVIGLGRIGRMFASKVRALGCQTIGCDPCLAPGAFESGGVERVELEELCRRADVVSIHCPLDAGTRHMVSDAQFALMKPSACLVNVSRGAVVDEAALVRALENKTIAGAALDVVETEPLPASSPLLRFDNCLITPHMAWYSEESAVDLKRKVAEEAVRMVKGETLRCSVAALG